MKINPNHPTGQVASDLLKARCSDLFQIMPVFSTTGPDPLRVHSVRSSIKRLRDTTVIFERLFGSQARTRLAMLAGLQSSLGAVHDLMTAKQLALRWAAGEDLSTFIAAIDREIATRSGVFQKEWERTFGTEVQRNRWLAFFSKLESSLNE